MDDVIRPLLDHQILNLYVRDKSGSMYHVSVIEHLHLYEEMIFDTNGNEVFQRRYKKRALGTRYALQHAKRISEEINGIKSLRNLEQAARERGEPTTADYNRAQREGWKDDNLD